MTEVVVAEGVSKPLIRHGITPHATDVELEAGEISIAKSQNLAPPTTYDNKRYHVSAMRGNANSLTERRRKTIEEKESRMRETAEAPQVPKDENSFEWWNELDFKMINFHDHYTTINHVYHEFKDWRFITGRPIKDYNNVHVSWNAFAAKYNKGKDAWYQMMVHLVEVALAKKTYLIERLKEMDLDELSALYAVRREMNLELPRNTRDNINENTNEQGRTYDNQWDDRAVEYNQQPNWTFDSNNSQRRLERPVSVEYEAPRSYPDSQAISRDTSRHSSVSYDQLYDQLCNAQNRLRESEERERVMKIQIQELSLQMKQLDHKIWRRADAAAKEEFAHRRLHSRMRVEFSRRACDVEVQGRAIQNKQNEVLQRLEDIENLQEHPVMVDVLTRLTLQESQMESLMRRKA
jgi:hypothetical protein